MVCPKCKLQLKVAKVKDGKRHLKCSNPQCSNYGKILVSETLSNDNNKKRKE